MLFSGLKIISHRGNVEGPNTNTENHPDQIEKVSKLGYDVEIDVWLDNNKFVLGHDKPQHEVSWEYLTRPYLWCHAKNINALVAMMNLGIHCFWHQEDDVTLTSQGYIWTYPGKTLTNKSICVMPERAKYDDKILTSNCIAGICTDFPKRYVK